MTDSNVVILPVITRLDLPPERILNAALSADLTEVVILGTDKDGNEYFASSQGGGPDVLWHLERAKLKLLGMPDA